MIYLFYLSDCRYGGWVSYTTHLYRALEAVGVEAHIVKIGAHTETIQRPFDTGVFYQNLSLNDALCVRGLITAVQMAHYRQQAACLLDAGCAITLHDPTELHAGGLEMLRRHACGPVFTVRRAVSQTLTASGVPNTLIPHPYVPVAAEEDDCPVARPVRAVTLSRVDFDKNTHIIADANRRGACIQIYGAVNRLYTYHKLEKAHPGWEHHYRGRFRSAVKTAQSADYVVDMSTIAGDGGGTQYTFLEAWDAAAHLVVNRKWLRADDPTVEDGRNCTAVGNGEELAQLMARRPEPRIVAAGRAQLQQHAPATVGVLYAEALPQLVAA